MYLPITILQQCGNSFKCNLSSAWWKLKLLSWMKFEPLWLVIMTICNDKPRQKAEFYFRLILRKVVLYGGRSKNTFWTLNWRVNCRLQSSSWSFGSFRGEFWSVKFIERQNLKKIVWLFLSPLGPRKIETKIELKSVFLYCMVAD